MPNLIDVFVTFYIDCALNQIDHHTSNFEWMHRPSRLFEVLPTNFKTYFSVKCPKLQGKIQVEKSNEACFFQLKGRV